MKIKVLFLASLMVAALSANAWAHEFVIKPNKVTAAKGESIKAEFMAAHVFDVSEEIEDPADVEATLWQNAQSAPVSVSPDEKVLALTGEAVLSADGPAWLVAHRKPQLWSQTPDGMLAGGPQELTDKKILYTNQYEKFSKLLINASLEDQSFNKPLGQMLEIVPLVNPAALKVGDELKVAVYYDGKPISVPVYATYLGFSQQPNTYAYYTAPEAGDAFVKITAPGLWMVRANYLAPGQDGIKTKDYKAILEFEVK